MLVPAPFSGKLRRRGEPRARIVAMLGVVGGRGEHRMGPPLGALLIGSMKSRERPAESTRIATDFVQRNEAVVTVKRRILEPFGGDRSAVLLQPHGAT